MNHSLIRLTERVWVYPYEEERDPALSEKLAGTIRALDASVLVEGHWIPTTKEDVVNDLTEA